MKVFLDIDIGGAAKYEQESAAYHRAVDFMQQCGSQYGLSGSLADLDEEGLQMLREGYSSDPNWSSKGGLRHCCYCQCCYYCCLLHFMHIHDLMLHALPLLLLQLCYLFSLQEK
jgi:hypothetical protein